MTTSVTWLCSSLCQNSSHPSQTRNLTSK